MSRPIFWSEGTHIAIREHWQNKIWTVRPVTVVQDSPELIALYMMPGTVYKYPCLLDGRPVSQFLPDDWVLIEREWFGGGALYLSQPNNCFALIGFFDDANEKINRWYINLQTPYQRTAIGFDYLDQELDIVVETDLQSWRWKDEAEFAEAQQRGRISQANAQRVQSVADGIVADLENGRFMLPHTWQKWRPPASWAAPVVPHGWDELS